MRLRSFGECYTASDFYKRCRSQAQTKVQWENLLDCGISDREQVEELLLRGVDDTLRARVWMAFASHGMDTVPEYNPSLASQVADKDEDIIIKDIPRTFTGSIGNAAAKDKIDELRRILEVYSATDTVTGYTQGMNFVVSILLLKMNEEDAYKTFFCMMNNPVINLKDFYGSGLSGFFDISTTWLRLLEKRYRWLWKKLNSDLVVHPALTVTKCFQSLLVAMDVPLELKFVMYDRVIVCGKRALVSFHLALVRIFAAELQSLSPSDAQAFLMHVDQRIALSDYQLVIDAWNKEWVSAQEFQT